MLGPGIGYSPKQGDLYRVILCAFLGALVLLNFYGGTTVTISPVKVLIQPKLALRGTTHIMLPPVGEISAVTHWIPVRLNIFLRHVDLSALEQLWQAGQLTEDKVFEILKGMKLSLVLLILQLTGIGALGGVLGLLVCGYRTIRHLKIGIILGLLTPVLLLGGVYLTYNVGAFNNPQYEGMIQGAPWMLSFIQENVNKVGEFSDQLQMVAGNLYTMFERMDELRVLSVPAGEVTLLHVSDLHNNPAALGFIQRIVDSFRVDAIIDTGDLTDLGTPLEAELLGQIRQFSVPYVFVPGNHETPEIRNRLRMMPNVQVVEDEAVQVAGLWIYGVLDPAAELSSPQPWTPNQLKTLLPQIAERMDAYEKIDILAVHNDWLAHNVVTEAQVTLCGHSHVFEVKEVEGQLIVNAGTTGAAGVRGFIVDEPVPYTVALLYFSPDEAGTLHLVAIDSVKVDVVGGGFSLQRHLVQTLFDQRVRSERGIAGLLSN
ncbi:MAG: metallophosphoesterase family protein [Limnochordia bacterium]|nr:metallophosphoesterase family protein [Limnochordia bacterium]